MKLTVLSPISHGGAGTDVSLEGIEAERDDLDEKLAARRSSAHGQKKKSEHTVPSGDRSLVTVPWGQPLPEVEALMILIRSPPGGLPDSNSMGLAATRAGASKARAAERIFGEWLRLGGGR